MPSIFSLPLFAFCLCRTALAAATTLTLTVPPHIPALPPSTSAILTATGTTLKAPVTRSNSFIINDLNSPADGGPASYLLDITCRDYDFVSYGVDVKGDGVIELYRVGLGGMEQGERITVGEGPVEMRVSRAREYYEARAGFSPLSLLKNPMMLIAVLGLAFVFGMPYLMDSMDPEMKKEFEEQQKKGVLSGGAKGANPLQNFDMAAWMAGQTSASTVEDSTAGGGAESRPRKKG